MADKENNNIIPFPKNSNNNLLGDLDFKKLSIYELGKIAAKRMIKYLEEK